LSFWFFFWEENKFKNRSPTETCSWSVRDLVHEQISRWPSTIGDSILLLFPTPKKQKSVFSVLSDVRSTPYLMFLYCQRK
jgi:hypothetical protein